eukprot:766709-Rhodomonas_salina.4
MRTAGVRRSRLGLSSVTSRGAAGGRVPRPCVAAAEPPSPPPRASRARRSAPRPTSAASAPPAGRTSSP